MSLPNVPNITPCISLKRRDAINLILSSIAMEEIGLSHILNAEGEKLQYFLSTCPEDLKSLLEINDSVNTTLRNVIKTQMLLQFKLEDAIKLEKESGDKSEGGYHFCEKCNNDGTHYCMECYQEHYKSFNKKYNRNKYKR